MTNNNQAVNAAPYMWVFGAIIFVGFFLYLLFMAVDTLGLATEQGVAEVTDKYYQEPHKTYIVQNVGGRNLTLPQSVDGAYIIHLILKNESITTYTTVSKSNYESAYMGQQLDISYQKSRLTDTIQVTHIAF